MENKNYNIKFNNTPLSDEDIDKHKDFDALLEKFNDTPQEEPQQRPAGVYWMRYVAGAVAAALIGVLVFVGLNKNNNNSVDPMAFADQPYINPPIDNVKAQFASYKVNANQGGVYKYKNGSKVIVPPSAFVDDQGRVVEGEVNIKYREFHDYVDFFLSGIPMYYDSSGVRYNLESAGMMEIYAEQNGKMVNLHPDKKIDVELVSNINMPNVNVPPSYNIYKLDTENKNWVYQDVDKIDLIDDPNASSKEASEITQLNNQFRESLQSIALKEQRKLEQIEATIPRPSQPVRPERRNDSEFVFDFDFASQIEETAIIGSDNDVINQVEQDVNRSTQEINQLRQQYAGTLWQIGANNNPNINDNTLNQNWDDVKINQVNNRDYELTFIKGAQQLKVIANPVLSGSDYDNAMAEFNTSFAKYQQELSEREAKLKTQKDNLSAEIEKEKELAQMEHEEKVKTLRAKGLNDRATDEIIKRKVVNRFQATSLGIWNCDRPMPPFLVQVKGNFMDDDKNDLNYNTAYLVDKNLNTVCRFHANKDVVFNFNSNSENLLWMVTKENKIAVFRPEKFKAIEKDEKDYTFVMDVIDQPINNEDDVRKILQF